MQIRVKSKNHFTHCWYDNHIGEVFDVLEMPSDETVGYSSYKVDVSRLINEDNAAAFGGVTWAYVARANAEELPEAP